MTESPIALVTGSGRRLGRTIALGLAEAGMDIILHANTSKSLLEAVADEVRAFGRHAWILPADLQSMANIDYLVGQVAREPGRLDVLINNAGVFPKAPFGEVTVNQWDEAMSINVRAPFFLAQGLAPLLRASHGCIVNLASAGAYRVWPNHVPYNVSKAALVMATTALATVLAPEVRVNAIAPGIISLPGEDRQEAIPPERLPLQSYGTPADLVGAVVYLCRATHVTGQVLRVDGGATL